MKSILTSKVFWVAVTQGIIGIMVAVDSVYPGIGWVVVAKSVLDIWLRFVTTTSVKL